MPRPTHRKLHPPPRRDRRLGEAAQCRPCPRQLDVHNQKGPRQNGPCLPEARPRISRQPKSQNLCAEELAVRRPSPGGKPSPVRRELVEESWDDSVKARAKAMSARIEDGL